MRVLALDNRDSFTFTLVDYLRQAGADVHVHRSDSICVAEALQIGRDGIMVSPGPGRPEDAGISVSLAREAVAVGRPFLGICLGHQALALACGSIVERVDPVHGKTASVSQEGSGLFADLPSPFDATRYHSLAVTEVLAPLRPSAWNADGLCMALHHEDAPAWGIQFHPESIASRHGHALLRAFVERCVSRGA